MKEKINIVEDFLPADIHFDGGHSSARAITLRKTVSAGLPNQTAKSNQFGIQFHGDLPDLGGNDARSEMGLVLRGNFGAMTVEFSFVGL